MKHPALFFLVGVLLSGCSIICGCQHPPLDGAGELHRKYFEAGRRSEQKGNAKIAGDSYDYLIKCGSFYGEYGLAMLLLRSEIDSQDAVKHLLSCAQRTSDMSVLFPVSVEEAAFSAAAMAKLSDIAESEHDGTDVAKWLRSKMAGAITQEVRDWAGKMKMNADSARIYADVISAVESSRPSREYVKDFKWAEIGKVLMKESAETPKSGGKAGLPPKDYGYSVVKFVKAPGAMCQYDFVVRLAGNVTAKETGKVRSDIRNLLVKEFLSANGYEGADGVRTSFPAWNQQASTIEGTVVVFKMGVVSLEYDESTGAGKIVVRLDGRDMSAAREWASKHIEELVADKNIEHVVGNPPPPGARYKTGRDITRDGLLEIEFSTRD